MTSHPEVTAAAHVLAATGLVDAFGHVSVRGGDGILITPAVPLADVGDELVRLEPGSDALPAAAPKEAWIHLAVYAARPDVGAICRAQPEDVTAAAAAGATIRALHGQGAFAGAEVPVFDDARLVRDRARGEQVAHALGDAPALALRGNGAITVGPSPGIAAARMHVLAASARINLHARGSDLRPLSAGEIDAWRAVEDEILGRLFAYLRAGA